MLHIFISAADDDIRPGATGRPVPGYEARVVDDDMRAGRPRRRRPARRARPDRLPLPRRPAPARLRRDGWNLTGDAYSVDADGYFYYQARTDDMIVTAGYNIAGPEVEEALLEHAAVLECAVVGAPDAERGQIVQGVRRAGGRTRGGRGASRVSCRTS